MDGVGELHRKLRCGHGKQRRPLSQVLHCIVSAEGGQRGLALPDRTGALLALDGGALGDAAHEGRSFGGRGVVRVDGRLSQ